MNELLYWYRIQRRNAITETEREKILHLLYKTGYSFSHLEEKTYWKCLPNFRWNFLQIFFDSDRRHLSNFLPLREKLSEFRANFERRYLKLGSIFEKIITTFVQFSKIPFPFCKRIVLKWFSKSGIEQHPIFSTKSEEYSWNSS